MEEGGGVSSCRCCELGINTRSRQGDGRVGYCTAAAVCVYLGIAAAAATAAPNILDLALEARFYTPSNSEIDVSVDRLPKQY